MTGCHALNEIELRKYCFLLVSAHGLCMPESNIGLVAPGENKPKPRSPRSTRATHRVFKATSETQTFLTES